MWLKVSNVTWSTSYFYVCADKTNGVLVSNYRKVRYKYIDILFVGWALNKLEQSKWIESFCYNQQLVFQCFQR